MKFREELGEFNRQFAAALRDAFAPEITPVEDERGVLYFRGPIPIPNNPRHIGSHVAVSLDEDVQAALDRASPSERAEMTENLIESLGGQIRAQYNPHKHGEFAVSVSGTMSVVRG